MPKSVREVKSFNLGVVTAADDNDIRKDAGTFSRDIDPNSTQGRLKGRYKDVLIDDSISKTVFQFIPPDTSGNVQREINVVWTTTHGGEVNHDIHQNDIIRGDVNLVGQPPTGDVVVKFKLDDYANVGTFIKTALHATNAIPPSDGEEVELTFTSSNWAQAQRVFLRPQNITIQTTMPIVVQVTAQSGDSNWNSTDVDFNRSFNYISNVLPCVVIKESTFDNIVQQGLQGDGRIDVKLSANPNFVNTSAVVSLTFTSQNTGLLKAHKPDGGAEVNSHTINFTNANYNTYQTVHPFGVDVAEKNGNENVTLSVTANSNNNPSYLALDTDLSNLVRFDTGNFETNDFTFAGTTDWNVLILDDGGDSGGDDGSDDGDDDGTRGFTGP